MITERYEGSIYESQERGAKVGKLMDMSSGIIQGLRCVYITWVIFDWNLSASCSHTVSERWRGGGGRSRGNFVV